MTSPANEECDVSWEIDPDSITVGADGTRRCTMRPNCIRAGSIGCKMTTDSGLPVRDISRPGGGNSQSLADALTVADKADCLRQRARLQ